jgi:TetR/AcrR family transcriptional repressor of nem operon
MTSSTKQYILDVAEKLAMERGYNGFSYRDVAKVVGIKTAAIHHHFPAKDDLAVALIERYAANLHSKLKDIDASGKCGYVRVSMSLEGIRTIADQSNDFCLCGMLAAEIYALSATAREKLRDFFQLFERWLSETIEAGINDGSIDSKVDPKSQALLILTVTEGGMLLSRLRPNSLNEAYDQVLLKLSTYPR